MRINDQPCKTETSQLANLPKDTPGYLTIVAPVILMCFAYVGSFKGLSILTEAPIDLTLFFAVLSALLLVRSWIASYSSATVRPVLAIWAVFVPGTFIGLTHNLPATKWVYLWTITLLAALCGAALIGRLIRIETWVNLHLGFALLMLVTSFLWGNSEYEATFGRLEIEGSTTILTSRIIGAGALVALLHVFSARFSRKLLYGAVFFGLSAGLLLIGSRGPFIALLGAALTAILTSRVFGRSRPAILASAALLAVLGAWALRQSDSRSVARLLSVFEGGNDSARQSLYSVAWQSIQDSPLGLGWGGFTRLLYGNVTDAAIPPAHPHNLILETALEGGWVAAIGVVIALFVAIGRAWKASATPALSAMYALLIYWTIASMTSSDVNGNRMLWIAVAASLAMRRNTFPDQLNSRDSQSQLS